MMNYKIIILLLVFSTFVGVYGESKHFVIVDKNGDGDFTTLTDAINSLPMFNYERITIFIKKGIYEEKIRFDQDYITLEGEDRDSTIIRYNQLRENWVKNKDSIGPAVININGDDIIFKNLTVINTQPEIGPHAFAIYGTGTRTVIIDCNVISKGGDTVSLWDYKTGMYYHANCYFEGAVDFVCPRGWCFIKDSKFFEVKKTAAIWHAGGYEKNQKFVLKNCSFDGVEGFDLGRHHYEAQFYLIDCEFSKNMSDKLIFRVTYKDSTRNRPFNWGKRYFFSNSTMLGEKYEWLKDNLDPTVVKVITPEWTFDKKWNPESVTGPKIIDYLIYKNEVLLKFSESVTVVGVPELLTSSDKKLNYVSGAGSNTLKFKADSELQKQELYNLKLLTDAKVIGNVASVSERVSDYEVVK